MTEENIMDLGHPSLLRRLMAIMYDSLALLATWMLATIIALPLAENEAFEAGNPLFTTYLFFVTFGYFAWFWTHGGQTIGMLSWHFKVVKNDGSRISLWHALLRFLCAIGSWLALGSGFLMALFNKDARTWHDKFSETELILVPKKNI